MKFTRNILKTLLSKASPAPQRSKEWFALRKERFTASEVAAILGYNPFQSPYKALYNKLTDAKFESDATKHGTRFEDNSKKYFEVKNGVDVHETGLYTKDLGPLKLGASPDGIYGDFRDRQIYGLEIKNVVTRKITGEIPIYYWIQMQVCMQTLGLDHWTYFETKYPPDAKEGDPPERYIQKIVARDDGWFNDHLPELCRMYSIYSLESDSTHSPEYTEAYLNSKGLYDLDTQAVKYTNITNYIQNDTVLDWLELYGSQKGYVKDRDTKYNFVQYIKDKNKQFRSKVFEYLKTRFDQSEYLDLKDSTSNRYASKELALGTVKAMRKHTPIIANAFFFDDSSSPPVYGNIDLLIREDYISKIFKETKIEAPDETSYVPVMIKFKTLELLSDGESLGNSGMQSAYKHQLALVSKALGKRASDNLQGGLLGRCYKYTSSGSTFRGNGCFDKLGVAVIDDDIMQTAQLALKTRLDIQRNGAEYDPSEFGGIDRDSRPVVNMKNQYSYPWHFSKSLIARKNQDVTLLWNVGMKHKINAEAATLKDRWCDSAELGMKTGTKRHIIDKLLKVNHSGLYDPVVMPRRLSKESRDLLRGDPSVKTMTVYIDFETVSNINDDLSEFPKISYEAQNYICVIGYVIDGQYYSHFIKDLSHRSEEDMVVEWMANIKRLYQTGGYEKIRYVHWTNAEKAFLNGYYNRSDRGDELREIDTVSEWLDLHKIFKDEPIIIKGCYDFKLKHIARSLYDHGLITTNWDSDNSIGDGLTACIALFETGCKNELVNKEILRYNEIDCAVLEEIHRFLSRKRLS
uniref:YqaJ viral recombinase domain-containing protein n=1 Tax=viral metagenome TaxID=1070528 RepID=A0A6C0CK13_9ZZZZ